MPLVSGPWLSKDATKVLHYVLGKVLVNAPLGEEFVERVEHGMINADSEPHIESKLLKTRHDHLF